MVVVLIESFKERFLLLMQELDSKKINNLCRAIINFFPYYCNLFKLSNWIENKFDKTMPLSFFISQFGKHWELKIGWFSSDWTIQVNWKHVKCFFDDWTKPCPCPSGVSFVPTLAKHWFDTHSCSSAVIWSRADLGVWSGISVASRLCK